MMIDDIKLIGVDLDGTLLTDEKELTIETKEIIKKLHKKGIHFVPITGRPLSGVPKCIRDIEEIEYAITSNGSQITDLRTNKAIFEFPIDNKKANEIIDILENESCMYEVFADSVGYIKQEEYDEHKKRFSGTPFGEYLFQSRRVTPSIKELFASSNKPADEIFILCDNEETRNRIARKMEQILGIQQCLIADRFLELTKKNIDKGYALSVLCEHLNLDLKSTIAFGDGENDLQFLEKAGIAVAMENAVNEVKQKADIITKSNNDNGVYEILKQIRI